AASCQTTTAGSSIAPIRRRADQAPSSSASWNSSPVMPSVSEATEHRAGRVNRDFQQQHPCPSPGRATGAYPGYVKDHVRPMAGGGPDAVGNLQWRTTAAAKAKDV